MDGNSGFFRTSHEVTYQGAEPEHKIPPPEDQLLLAPNNVCKIWWCCSVMCLFTFSYECDEFYIAFFWLFFLLYFYIILYFFCLFPEILTLVPFEDFIWEKNRKKQKIQPTLWPKLNCNFDKYSLIFKLKIFFWDDPKHFRHLVGFHHQSLLLCCGCVYRFPWQLATSP